MASPNPLARYVLALYRRGELATLEEGALIADTSRSRVLAWLDAAGIDWKGAREHFKARHRTRAHDMMTGKSPAKKPSKAQQRAMGERLVAEFRRKGGRCGKRG